MAFAMTVAVPVAVPVSVPLAARALVTGRSLIVGCVVPGLMHSFFGEVARGLTNVFRKRGYGLVLATSEEESYELGNEESSEA